MQKIPLANNPFALIMDPEAVFQAIERSERLQNLKRHVCRPLDKPLIPKIGEEDTAARFWDDEENID